MKLHTVLMLVGPSNCGKTHFCQNFLIPRLRQLTNGEANVQCLSTDQIRRQLLGQEVSKHTAGASGRQVMLEASGPAFDVLHHTLNAVTSFPIKAEFVVVDSTGLSEEFRKRISDTCRENAYHLDLVLFQFKEKDYYSLPGGKSSTTRRQIPKMREFVSGPRSKDLEVNNKWFVKRPGEHPNMSQVSDWDLYASTRLDPECRYLIIGDVHGCLKELTDLIITAGFAVEGGIVRSSRSKERIILIGDVIDKGPQVRETIEFIHSNLRHPDNLIRLVMGNHENTVYKLLHGITRTTQYETGMLDRYFSTYHLLKDDAELAAKFDHVHDSARPFLHYRSPDDQSRSFFVSHSPCHLRHLGKTDSRSLRSQMYFNIDRNRDTMEQFVSLISGSGDQRNFPLHVFGHVTFPNPYVGFRDGNCRVGIDTGCVESGYLSAVRLGKGVYKPEILRVKSRNFVETPDAGVATAAHAVASGDAENPAYRCNPVVDGCNPVVDRWNALGYLERKRICGMVKNGVNFISGTVSPADKSSKEGVGSLESLQEGLNYYQKRGINRLVLQYKYMGSRCNVYLDCLDPDRSYSISRNGYRVRQVPHERMSASIYRPLHSRLEGFILANDAKMMIIDGELMPWNALGEDLISSQFKVIDRCLQDELDALHSSGFQLQLLRARQRMSDLNFPQRVATTAHKTLREELGDTEFTTMSNLHKCDPIDLDEDRKFWENYHRQILIYGQPGELHFKPFNLLKIVTPDKEIIPFIPNPDLYLDQVQIFELLSGSDKERCVIDLMDPDSREQSEAFFGRLLSEQMEGLVIKPVDYDGKTEGVAPFLKVRNESYLSIIYGYDYHKESNYHKLIRQKSIMQKLRKSISEFQLGLKLLRIPYRDLNMENSDLIGTLMEMTVEDSKCDIDPRL